METTEPSPINLASASPNWSRPHLSTVTNSPPRTPTNHEGKTVRRKASLIRRVDSSEGMPSSHESIFHAERFSSTNSEDNDSGFRPKVLPSPIFAPSTGKNLVGNNENIKDQLMAPALTIGNTPILYGHGTALTTIIEQKSNTTVRTKVSSAHPASTSEVSLARSSIAHFLSHRNSFDLPSSVTLRSPRRRKSFSADDLIIIKRSYHEACATIERSNNASLRIQDIYAKPRKPILPPIERPSTPPGIPSWTAAQTRPVKNSHQTQYRGTERTKNRLHRILGIRPSRRIHFPLRIGQHNQNNELARAGMHPSSPLPVRPAPRFRPIRSGHGVGSLRLHPFHNASLADAKSDTISTIPEPQIPDIPSAPRPEPGFLESAIRTDSGGKRRRGRQDQTAGCIQVSRPDAFIFRSGGSGFDDTSSLCLHHHQRQVSPWSTNYPAEATLLDPTYLTLNYIPLSLHDPEGDPTQEPISLSNVADPIARSQSLATVLPITDPLMTSAVPDDTSINGPPAKIRPKADRCWKCQVSAFISTLDDLWDASTSWCYWMFCGVDLHDDGEPAAYGNRDRSRRGDTQQMLGPKRVILHRVPATS